jgi:hypothetical protein
LVGLNHFTVPVDIIDLLESEPAATRHSAWVAATTISSGLDRHHRFLRR